MVNKPNLVARMDKPQLEALLDKWEKAEGYDYMRNRLAELCKHQHFTWAAQTLIDSVMVAY